MNNAIAIPAFKDNYIWLIPAAQATVVIVDPGDERPVLSYLQAHHLTPVAMIITHQCYDHVDGIKPILAQYDIPVYGPATEHIPGMSHAVKQNDIITLDSTTQLRVLDVPGHTAGHVAYYQPGTPGQLFCGDTLFSAGCGRLHTRLYDEMFKSLQLISALPGDTLIYCAHEYTLANLKFAAHMEPGNDDIRSRITQATALRGQDAITLPSRLSDEKKINPFLRCHTPEVMATATRYATESGIQPPHDAATTFRVIRDWKDRF